MYVVCIIFLLNITDKELVVEKPKREKPSTMIQKTARVYVSPQEQPDTVTGMDLFAFTLKTHPRTSV